MTPQSKSRTEYLIPTNDSFTLTFDLKI